MSYHIADNHNHAPPDHSDSPIPPPPMDLKLKLMIGSNFSIELVRSRLNEGEPEAVALLASKYVPSISPGAHAHCFTLPIHRWSEPLNQSYTYRGASQFLTRQRFRPLHISPLSLTPYLFSLSLYPPLVCLFVCVDSSKKIPLPDWPRSASAHPR